MDFTIRKIGHKLFSAQVTTHDVYIFDTGFKGEMSSWISDDYDAARFLERQCNKTIKNFNSKASFSINCKCSSSIFGWEYDEAEML